MLLFYAVIFEKVIMNEMWIESRCSLTDSYPEFDEVDAQNRPSIEFGDLEEEEDDYEEEEEF